MVLVLCEHNERDSIVTEIEQIRDEENSREIEI